jgi:transglutaminase-like putative cysteine protease
MRFGLVHRLMTDALAALGVLAVVSTASMSPATNAILLLGLALALAVPERWQTRPPVRHFAAVAPLAIFVVQAGRLVAGRPMLDVAVEFAALLQIVRLATRRGAAHDQQIIVLALLHFVAGTVLGGGLTYGLCFVGFLVVAPGALVLSHLRREVEGNYRQGARDRTGLPVDVPRILRSRRVVGRGFLGATCLMSVPIFLFTATLFLLFPRVGLSLLLFNHPHATRMVGFSPHINLDDVGVLRLNNPTIALRFDIPDLPAPPPPHMILRLRGTAFDTYDGHAWSHPADPERKSDKDRSVPGSDVFPMVRAPEPGKDRKISFDLESIDPPVVFLPPRAVAIQVKPQNQPLLAEPLALQRGAEGEVRYSGADARGLRYDVYLAKDKEFISDPLLPHERSRYLALPPGHSARVAALAHEWSDGLPNDLAKAKAIEEKLRTSFKYDHTAPSGGTKDPLDHFLFESKRGHCEFFSTAMAMLLREVGIPSRNVSGFVGGTYNRFGHFYAVREQDAHSWIEAYIDDPQHPGWQTFDPTPPAGAQPLEDATGTFAYVRDLMEALSQRWNRYVVGYDLRTQVRLFEDASRRYDNFRHAIGFDHGPLKSMTRPPFVAAGVAALLAGAYFLWKRRQRSGPAKSASRPKSPLEKRLESAAALYRALEGALSTHGIARPAALPPLRHAELLHASQHPLADEIMALTKLYVEARFGGLQLTTDAARDYERRVRTLRSIKLEKPPPSAAPATP